MHLVSTGRRGNVWEWLAQSAVVTGEGCQAAGGQAGCAGAAVVKGVTSMAQRRQVLIAVVYRTVQIVCTEMHALFARRDFPDGIFLQSVAPV